MCFRPATVKATICPNCKKKVGSVAGIKPKNCPFCKAELTTDPSPAEKPKA